MGISASQVDAGTPSASLRASSAGHERLGESLTPLLRTLRRHESALVLLLMSLLAVAWFWHTWAAPTTRTVGLGNDSYILVWSLAWFPHALSHGLNPLVTHYVNAPDGANLMWSPVMPILALLVSPITVTAGPVVAYNVIATAAPALAGWAAYLAIRHWTSPTPALVGALVFAFSPFVAAQSVQHGFLTFSLSAPLMLILLHRLLVLQRTPAWRDGIWLGLLLWAQLLISEEVLAIEVVIAAPAVAVAALLDVRAIRSRLSHAGRGVAVALGVAGALSAYPLAVQFLGPGRPTRAFYSPAVYSADLWNFISPTKLTAVHTASALSLDRHFTGNWTEWGSYVGIPLLVTLLGCLFICRHRRVAWVALAITASAALVSLGPSLHVAGRDTGISLPWHVVTGLPLLRNLLPARAAGMMFLGAGLLLALGLEELRHRGLSLRAGGYGLAVFSLVVLAPAAPYLATPLPISASLVAGRACPANRGETILLLSSPEEYSALWQAQAGFCFATVSADGLHIGNATPFTSVVGEATLDGLVGAPMPHLNPSVRARARRVVQELKPSAIVLPPTPAPAAATAHANLDAWFTAVLGTPPRRQGDMLVWFHPWVTEGP